MFANQKLCIFIFQDPEIQLREMAKTANLSIESESFANYLDENDELKEFRKLFELPEKSLYFCGNSLGMPPKKAKDYLDDVYHNWATKYVSYKKSIRGILIFL